MGLQLPTSTPALYATEKVDANDKIIHARLFVLASASTFLIAEYNPDEKVAFGYVDLYGNGDLAEWGNISIEELESLKWCGIPQVQRDAHFSPKPFRECVRANGSII